MGLQSCVRSGPKSLVQPARQNIRVTPVNDKDAHSSSSSICWIPQMWSHLWPRLYSLKLAQSSLVLQNNDNHDPATQLTRSPHQSRACQWGKELNASCSPCTNYLDARRPCKLEVKMFRITSLSQARVFLDPWRFVQTNVALSHSLDAMRVCRLVMALAKWVSVF